MLESVCSCPLGCGCPGGQPWSSLCHQHPAQGLAHSRCSGGFDGGSRVRRLFAASGPCCVSSLLEIANFYPPTGWYSTPQPLPWQFLQPWDLTNHISQVCRPALHVKAEAHPPPTANHQETLALQAVFVAQVASLTSGTICFLPLAGTWAIFIRLCAEFAVPTAGCF